MRFGKALARKRLVIGANRGDSFFGKGDFDGLN
jgi:hypothetical protein